MSRIIDHSGTLEKGKQPSTKDFEVVNDDTEYATISLKDLPNLTLEDLRFFAAQLRIPDWDISTGQEKIINLLKRRMERLRDGLGYNDITEETRGLPSIPVYVTDQNNYDTRSTRIVNGVLNGVFMIIEPSGIPYLIKERHPDGSFLS